MNSKRVLAEVSVFIMITIAMVHCDYMTIVSSSSSNLLAWVTENGTVVNIGDASAISDPTTIISDYYLSGQTYYALHDYKYLFSYSPASLSNASIMLQVPQGYALVSLCVSQQFGTVYAIQSTGVSTAFVLVDVYTGELTPASSTFSLPSNTVPGQCIVDDAYSRMVWTYKSTNPSLPIIWSIATTDLLPQGDGLTNPIYNDTISQIRLFFDWMREIFYATTLTPQQQQPQVSILSIAVDGVKKSVLINKVGVNTSTAEGALNTDSGILSLFLPQGEGGFIEQVNLANSSWAHVNIAWGSLGSLSVNPLSVVWAPHPEKVAAVHEDIQ